MVCLSVCLSVMIMSPAKTAELIEMLFGLWTRVGRRKYVLDQILPSTRAVFRRKRAAHCKVYRHSAVAQESMY